MAAYLVTSLRVPHEHFIRKLLPVVDALTPRAITDREVATLHHEIRYDAMEAAPFVMQRFPSQVAPNTFLSCAQCTKVLCRFGHLVCKEGED